LLPGLGAAGRPIRRRLPGLARPTKPASSLRLSHLSFKSIYLTCSPIARFTALCGCPSAPLRICRRSHLPACAPPCVIRFSLLLVARAHPRLSLLALVVPPTARGSLPRCRARRPSLQVLVVLSRASGRCPVQPRAPMSVARAGGARAPRPVSTGPDLPSHMLQMYISSI
jgi:hypothetical protein